MSSSTWIETSRHFLALAVTAFWLGGFAFYSSVVIHTGHHVFGSRVETGFLTQQVTHWLNHSGVVALTVLLANGCADWSRAGRWVKRLLWITWALMAVLLVALYALHPVLDRMLDAETQSVLNRSRFYGIHRIYMNVSTAQWLIGCLHVWLMLQAWRSPQGQLARQKEAGHREEVVHDDRSA